MTTVPRTKHNWTRLDDTTEVRKDEHGQLLVRRLMADGAYSVCENEDVRCWAARLTSSNSDVHVTRGDAPKVTSRGNSGSRQVSSSTSRSIRDVPMPVEINDVVACATATEVCLSQSQSAKAMVNEAISKLAPSVHGRVPMEASNASSRSMSEAGRRSITSQSAKVPTMPTLTITYAEDDGAYCTRGVPDAAFVNTRSNTINPFSVVLAADPSTGIIRPASVNLQTGIILKWLHSDRVPHAVCDAIKAPHLDAHTRQPLPAYKSDHGFIQPYYIAPYYNTLTRTIRCCCISLTDGRVIEELSVPGVQNHDGLNLLHMDGHREVKPHYTVHGSMSSYVTVASYDNLNNRMVPSTVETVTGRIIEYFNPPVNNCDLTIPHLVDVATGRAVPVAIGSSKHGLVKPASSHTHITSAPPASTVEVKQFAKKQSVSSSRSSSSAELEKILSGSYEEDEHGNKFRMRVRKVEMGVPVVVKRTEKEGDTRVLKEYTFTDQVPIEVDAIREDIVENVIVVPHQHKTTHRLSSSRSDSEIVEFIPRTRRVEVPSGRTVVVKKPVYKTVRMPRKVPTMIYKEVEKHVEVPVITYEDEEQVMEVIEVPEKIVKKEYVDVPTTTIIKVPKVVVKDVEVEEVVYVQVPRPLAAKTIVDLDLPVIKKNRKVVEYNVQVPVFVEVPVNAALLGPAELARAKGQLEYLSGLRKAKPAASLCAAEDFASAVLEGNRRLQLLNNNDLEASLFRSVVQKSRSSASRSTSSAVVAH